MIYRCALTNNRSYRRCLFVELSLAVYYSPLVLLLCLYSFSLCNFFMSLLKKKKQNKNHAKIFCRMNVKNSSFEQIREILTLKLIYLIVKYAKLYTAHLTDAYSLIP